MVLFDEVEKAHADVFNVLLQVPQQVFHTVSTFLCWSSDTPCREQHLSTEPSKVFYSNPSIVLEHVATEAQLVQWQLGIPAAC